MLPAVEHPDMTAAIAFRLSMLPPVLDAAGSASITTWTRILSTRLGLKMVVWSWTEEEVMRSE
jgi:hypothetical protein